MINAGACFRAMHGDDLDEVMRVEKNIYPFPWSRGNFKDALNSGFEAWIFPEQAGGATLSDNMIGYAVLMWTIDEIHLLNLSVRKENQGQGWGRAMLSALGADAARRGARVMLLEVRPSNTAAIGLYESLKFFEIGRRKDYYPSEGGQREPAIVLQAVLPFAE